MELIIIMNILYYVTNNKGNINNTNTHTYGISKHEIIMNMFYEDEKSKE